MSQLSTRNVGHGSLANAMGGSSFADPLQKLMGFWHALRKYKIYVVASVMIASLLGSLYYYTATRIYEAKAVVMVMQNGSDYWETSSSNSGRTDLLPTYERLFASDAVLKGAAKRLHENLAGLSSQWLADFEMVNYEDWPDVIRNSLTTSIYRRTQLIELRYHSKHPEGAVAVIDAVVDSYLDYIDTNHRDTSAKIFEMLEGERKSVETRLSQKNAELLELSKSVKALGIGSEQVVQPTVQRAISLNQALIDVQKERVNLEATSNAIEQAARFGGDLRQHFAGLGDFSGRSTIEHALGNSVKQVEAAVEMERKIFDDKAELARASQFLGATHPRVVQLKESIRSSMLFVDSIRRKSMQELNPELRNEIGLVLRRVVAEQLAKQRAHEAELLARYNEAEKSALMLNDQQAQLSLVSHETQRLRTLHDTLLDRMANIEIKQDRADVRVSVTEDPEANGVPVTPSRTRTASYCLFFGFGIGVVLVYGLDLLEDRFRTPEELADQVGAPVLAVVREIPQIEGKGIDTLQVHVAPNSVETEAFRTLRTALAFSGSSRRILSITSPEPNDGKTTVAANLAVSFAQSGRRTLLIDCDLRKPGLSKLFGLRGVSGVADVLQGSQPIAESCLERISSAGMEGLDILPCGPKTADPSVLLESPRFEDMLAWAEGEYDQVLVDCPPIMAASDAVISGRATEGLLIVIQPEKNHRRLIMRAAANIASFDVPIIGLVANRIRTETSGGYSYGYGYGYGYGQGYGEEDTNESELNESEQDSDRRAA